MWSLCVSRHNFTLPERVPVRSTLASSMTSSGRRRSRHYAGLHPSGNCLRFPILAVFRLGRPCLHDPGRSLPAAPPMGTGISTSGIPGSLRHAEAFPALTGVETAAITAISASFSWRISSPPMCKKLSSESSAPKMLYSKRRQAVNLIFTPVYRLAHIFPLYIGGIIRLVHRSPPFDGVGMARGKLPEAERGD